jgi:PEP-CTERM motif
LHPYWRNVIQCEGKFMTRAFLAIAAAAAMTLAAPAAAVTTFATFSGLGANIRFEKTGATTGNLFTIAAPADTVPGAATVNFQFINPPLPVLASLGVLSAQFSMTGTVSAAATALGSGIFVQPVASGSFSFLSTSDITIGSTTYAAGSNLLTGTFSNASIFGSGTSGSLSGSTVLPGTLTFSSAFLNFAVTDDRDFAISLTQISPALAALAGQSLNSFTAFGGGSFSSEPAPQFDPPPGVPEPSSWALLLAGMGLVGLAIRRRRALATA